MQPINYLLENKNPLDMLMGGVSQWQNMKNNDYALARTADENRLLKAQHDNEIQGMTDLQNLDFNNPDHVRQYAARYPALAKGVTTYMDNLEAKEKQAMLGDMSKSISLLKNGDNVNAAKMARDKAAAYKNAGDTKKAAEYEQIASMMETHPTSALQSLQMSYALSAGKDSMAGYKDYMEANAPKVKEFSSGGETGAYVIDPVTGKMAYQSLVKNTVSPDAHEKNVNDYAMNVNDNTTSTNNNIRNNQTQIQTTQMNGQYGLQREQMVQDGANSRNAQDNATKQFEIKSSNDISWFKVKTDANQKQQELEIQKNAGANGKPMTESQAKANIFGNRMLAADAILNNFEAQGITAPVLSHMGEWGESASRGIPSFLGGATEEQRQYMQAQRDWLNAVLRQESGAVIGADEFANAKKQYFPQLGDSPEVIRQKAENRARATQLVLQGAGQGGRVGGGQSVQSNQPPADDSDLFH